MVPPQKEDQNVCIGRVNAECSGTNLSETFITDCLTTENKKQVKTWRTAAKNVKLAAGSRQKCGAAKTDLFARMLVITKSRPEINPRETVRKYKFFIVPRATFGADCTVLHCSFKRSMEKLPTNNQETGRQEVQTAQLGDPIAGKLVE